MRPPSGCLVQSEVFLYYCLQLVGLINHAGSARARQRTESNPLRMISNRISPEPPAYQWAVWRAADLAPILGDHSTAATSQVHQRAGRPKRRGRQICPECGGRDAWISSLASGGAAKRPTGGPTLKSDISSGRQADKLLAALGESINWTSSRVAPGRAANFQPRLWGPNIYWGAKSAGSSARTVIDCARARQI